MKKLSIKLAKLFRLIMPASLIGLILTANIFSRENRPFIQSVSDRLHPHPVLAQFKPDQIAAFPTPVQKDIRAEITDTRSWTKFKYSQLIAETAQKYQLDPQVIYATIMTESEGNEYAYRYEPHLDEPSLCMGQILVSTARSLGFKDDPVELFDPETCIDLIGKYHRSMLDTYSSLTPQQLARAYNTGSPWKRPVYGHLARFNMWYNEES